MAADLANWCGRRLARVSATETAAAERGKPRKRKLG